MASSAALSTFKRVYADPEGEQTRLAFEDRRGRYLYLWHYYQNSAFEDLARWRAYKGSHRLYRYTRSIYNPTRRLVDFYAGTIYQGVLATDAERLPDGQQLAIPFADDTPPEILSAVGQFWQWSNWQAGKSLMARYGAALGDVAVRIVDDLERGKVYAEVLWPGLIRDLDLDGMGNVKAYALEYDVEDEAGRKYTYRQEVDTDRIATYRDDQPWSYDDQPPEYANPYGFVPLVWVKHTDVGGDHGEPALRSVGKVDELNSLASQAMDQARKILAAPILVSGKNVRRLDQSGTKAGATEDLTTSRQEEINILGADEGAQISAIMLEAGETLEHMDRMIREIEHDHPEVGMYNKLREQQQVTGPGAERMFGDVATLVADARANYDTQSIKLFQMALAIGGWRANRGDWGPLSRQQETFAPFGLESYARGDLDFEIQPRPLIPLTPREALELERAKLALAQDRDGFVQAGNPAGVAQRLRAAAGAA